MRHALGVKQVIHCDAAEMTIWRAASPPLRMNVGEPHLVWYTEDGGRQGGLYKRPGHWAIFATCNIPILLKSQHHMLQSGSRSMRLPRCEWQNGDTNATSYMRRKGVTDG